jgi:FKBP-type peptidyl-prolyl cis-trans isomerase 2
VIDPDFIDDVVAAFLAAIEQNPALPKVVNLQSFNAESPDHDAIIKALAARGGEQLRFSDSEKKIVSTVKDFKVEGSNVSFNAEIEGASVKFEGKVEGAKMSGKLEAQEGDNKIPGEWVVTKNDEGKPKR